MGKGPTLTVGWGGVNYLHMFQKFVHIYIKGGGVHGSAEVCKNYFNFYTL